MKLYIDPGTGSMLFAILIGIIGALNFALRGWIIKLRFLLSGGEKTAVDQEKHPLAVFVDDKRYWNVMEPVCRELDRRGLDVAYLTASPDDPALQNPYAHVHAEFLGEGNKAFAKLNFLRANVLLSTTPGLDVYQWKRSPGVDCYVHILHAANEVAGYRMFGIDYYDTVFVSGDYQIRDLRALEALRGLPAKEVVKIGIPYMDEMKRRLDAAGPIAPHRTTVLIAPSWGPSAENVPHAAGKTGRPAERAFPETCRGAAAQQSCAPAGTLSSSMSRLSLPSFSAERSMPLEAMPIILRGGRFRIATTVLPTSSSGR